MNYPENTVDWPVGSLVIHDMDHKSERMVMKVVKVQGDVYHTEYIHPEQVYPGLPASYIEKRNKWQNRKEVLHCPSRFKFKGGVE